MGQIGKAHLPEGVRIRGVRLVCLAELMAGSPYFFTVAVHPQHIVPEAHQGNAELKTEVAQSHYTDLEFSSHGIFPLLPIGQPINIDSSAHR